MISEYCGTAASNNRFIFGNIKVSCQTALYLQSTAQMHCPLPALHALVHYSEDSLPLRALLFASRIAGAAL